MHNGSSCPTTHLGIPHFDGGNFGVGRNAHDAPPIVCCRCCARTPVKQGGHQNEPQSTIMLVTQRKPCCISQFTSRAAGVDSNGIVWT